MAELLLFGQLLFFEEFHWGKILASKNQKRKRYILVPMWFFKFQRYGKIEAFCLVNQKTPVSEKCSNSSMKNGIKIIK